MNLFRSSGVRWLLVGVAFLAAAVLAAHPGATGFALAIVVAATTRDLKTVISELKAIQQRYTGKAIPPNIGREMELLAIEASNMQTEVDAIRFGAKAEDDVVASLSIGQAFTRSAEYQEIFHNGTFPEGSKLAVKFEHATLLRGGVPKGREGRVPLTRKQLAKFLESKAVPTIGSGVVRVERDPEAVRAATAETDNLTIRDLVNVSETDSAVIDYTVIDSQTRAAAPTAANAAKPESTTVLSNASVPVRTIAVWMPATEQQIMDVPQLENIIDVELAYDLAKVEEEQLMWGRGTGENLLGIMKTPGVPAGRTVVGDTLLDKIRRAITDVRVNGKVSPNGIAVHPLDWEEIVLLKGTDARYVWAVVSDENGERLWSLRVVETIATTDVLDAVNTTKQRVVLVGDFRRGATLWDRLKTQIVIGWINDDFIKNRNVIRAEERIAFGVKRPKAFSYIQTVAAAA